MRRLNEDTMILIEDLMHNKDKVIQEFPIYLDRSFKVTKLLEVYITIRNPFERIATRHEELVNKHIDEAINKFKGMKGDRLYDYLYERMLPRAFSLLEDTAELAIGVLQTFSINHIDAPTWAQMLYNDGFVEEAYGELDRINNRMLEYAHEIEPDESSMRWVGGGFGVTGAIKGAIIAGAMNMGMDLLKEMGKTITGTSEKQQIRDLKIKAIDLNLLNLLRTAVCDLDRYAFDETYDMIIYELGLPRIDFDAAQAEDDYKSIVLLYQNNIFSKENTMEGMAHCIIAYPYHIWAYMYLYRLDKTLKANLEAIADHLGLTIPFDFMDTHEDFIPGFN